MKRYFLMFFLLVSQNSLFSRTIQEEEPWFAGTMLSFYARNTLPGRFAVQPYLFATRQLGVYDSNWALKHDRNVHQYEVLLSLETGITDKIDVNLLINGIYANSSGKDVFSYGDTELLFGFQISVDKKDTIIPDFRILIGENFPTGDYTNLSPALKGGDASGTGSYQTLLIFILRKILYTRQGNAYNWNLNLYYIHSSKTNVEGFSIYGGLADTKGVVTPGNTIIANLAYEYKFNRKWGTGIDMRYTHQNSTSFHRENRSCSFAGLPSLQRFSIAPCVEYVFSESASVVGGLWMSVLGRNDIAFMSGVLTVYYEF